MTTPVDLKIKVGLPFSKVFVVTLPGDRSWWTDISQVEVNCQIREQEDRDSALICDLTQFMTMEFTDADTIQINLIMTGQDTPIVTDSGYYDVLLSDPGTTNDRVIQISLGKVIRRSVVSKESS